MTPRFLPCLYQCRPLSVNKKIEKAQICITWAYSVYNLKILDRIIFKCLSDSVPDRILEKSQTKIILLVLLDVYPILSHTIYSVIIT